MEFVASLLHPSELWALFRFAREQRGRKEYFGKDASLGRGVEVDRTRTRNECYHFLNKTSRSFAAVVQALDAELRDPVRLSVHVMCDVDLYILSRASWSGHCRYDAD